MIIKQLKILVLLVPFAFSSIANARHIITLQQGKPSNIRGLTIVNNNIAWISGSKGYVAHTIDAGKTWIWQQVKGYENADFRSIEAFSDKKAIIMSSGTPALILKTVDGGKSWKLKYKNVDTTYFLDAMSFSDTKHGFILGDPINNKFLMLETIDGGESWHKNNNTPNALANEAAFAASSTCLRTTPRKKIIVTGGSSAGVYMQPLNGKWIHHLIPICNGQASKGAFSIGIMNNKMVIVGGDYKHDKDSDSTACYSIDGGLNWQLSKVPPAGYQSCVVFIKSNVCLSTGTPGSCITTDGGRSWHKIDDTGFNVCSKAKYGNFILLAGNDGKIAIYKP